ncbi:hypothetical protein [Bifidobacterium oedipodis]|uniref:Uncharacterized protein n=1 Tax=Bifidobacterium oedipodis TaxID=2675322 RepID=A0A7Y0ENT1_9BIFI|nr:hypothetical protein [Bifidobacterium sp. DSM 109957]NMM93680.1 hypothetical protein [Bifidobacterium sp. DSM 109957]
MSMKTKRWLGIVAVAVLLASGAGCGANGNDGDNGHAEQTSVPLSTVKVESGTLVPTISSDAVVSSHALFAVTAPVQGVFQSTVNVGDTIQSQQVLGSVADTQILAPAEGTVASIASSGTQVPLNYPLITVNYNGFAMELDASRLLRMTQSTDSIHGKFQITDGQSPSDCAAVLPVQAVSGTSQQSNGTQENSGDNSSSTRMTCLVPKDDNVREGESGILVISGTAVSSSLLLPVSAVAGRSGKGTVTRISHNKQEQVEVTLGASDGARIVIVDGLAEGDEVLDTAPNLATKRIQ